MAATPVTINGIAYPKNKKDPPFPVTIVGQAWITGLSVGGGPMPGGSAPARPDQGLPGAPVYPDHTLPPIEQPPPEIPTVPSDPKPPPPEGGWGWSPQYGWGYFPGSGGAGPKR